jgi:hypothetical protein
VVEAPRMAGNLKDNQIMASDSKDFRERRHVQRLKSGGVETASAEINCEYPRTNALFGVGLNSVIFGGLAEDIAEALS